MSEVGATGAELCPAQQDAYEGVRRALSVGSVLAVWSGAGMGRTTLLRRVHRERGGAFLGMKEFIEAMRDRPPMALEETFYQMVREGLRAQDTVIVDDLHLLNNVTCCNHFYPRAGFLNTPLTALCAWAADTGKKLVFGCAENIPSPLRQRGIPWGIRDFTPDDYAFLCRAFLGPERAGRLDCAKIHRFAPRLNVHQIRGACEWLRDEPDLDTERFVEYLRSQRMASNVDLGEVQAVDLHDLKGVDDVLQALEANIILPLENDALAAELNIKPRRGVLLAGPPGTGKTTVGRALAHRLKSKFFLIDGTFISGTQSFYQRVEQVFEAARQNAPSIIFLDDSDVIFESGEEMGLYRYLLTMLDGLESESAGRVCVMLTAMDVGNLPPALIRSGRIELWLETRLPDEEARAAILEQRAAGLPEAVGPVDVARLAAATEGLTGADLKRLMEDGTILYAYDRAGERPLKPATEYYLKAVETVRANKARYAEAEARARSQRPARPPWFDVAGLMAFQQADEE